jgi:hypothetical protein
MNSVFFNHINKEEIKEKLHSGEFPFSQHLFWDTPIEKIDQQKNKRHIIERVITRGLLEDFYTLLQLYSTDDISDAITRSKVLDSKTANFCSIIFNIPKSKIHVSPYYG